eukprot:1181409-Prymnesium_polylepis.1
MRPRMPCPCSHAVMRRPPPLWPIALISPRPPQPQPPNAPSLSPFPPFYARQDKQPMLKPREVVKVQSKPK